MTAKPASGQRGRGKRGETVRVKLVRLPHAAELPLPRYQTEDAAGLDLLAAVDIAHPLTLAPGTRTLVPTGLVMELPRGFEAQVRPRSGLALNNGVTVLNAPGTIDADYRGEVRVLLVNLGQVPVDIRRGDRIAQLVVCPVTRAVIAEVDALSNTVRGKGGFGSTGIDGANQNAASRQKSPAKKSNPQRPTSKKKSPTAKPHSRNR